MDFDELDDGGLQDDGLGDMLGEDEDDYGDEYGEEM